MGGVKLFCANNNNNGDAAKITARRTEQTISMGWMLGGMR
jgi:hypothetical protein